MSVQPANRPHTTNHTINHTTNEPATTVSGGCDCDGGGQRAAGEKLLVAHQADKGQATAEYALVLLGAAAVALLLIGWATTTDQVSRLFDFVVDQVIGRSG